LKKPPVLSDFAANRAVSPPLRCDSFIFPAAQDPIPTDFTEIFRFFPARMPILPYAPADFLFFAKAPTR
jgi:hypothetical protein